MHLSAVNEHVKTILDLQANKTGAAPGWHLPRHSSGAACTAASLAGVSSFAFQGTNAHALVQQAPESLTATGSARLTAWAHQRLWVAPPVHAMLQSVTAVGAKSRRQQQLLLEGGLGVPQLSFMWQHVINGVALLPASAFLELGSAAAGILLNAGSVSAVALRHAVFTTPLILRGANKQPKASIRSTHYASV